METLPPSSLQETTERRPPYSLQETTETLPLSSLQETTETLPPSSLQETMETLPPSSLQEKSATPLSPLTLAFPLDRSDDGPRRFRAVILRIRRRQLQAFCVGVSPG